MHRTKSKDHKNSEITSKIVIMATLIARNQSRSSIQAIIDYVEDENFQERDYVQIYNRREYLLEQWALFVESNNELRATAQNAEDEQQHADIFTALEPLYLETKSVLDARLHQLNVNNPSREPQFSPEYMQMMQQQQQQREIVVRLDQPKREVENTWGEFGGSLTKWRGFCDSFTDRVHNDESLAPVHKFRLLKNSLKGKAAAALGEWELSDANYVEAWNRLKELYEQTYQTGYNLVLRLTKLSKLEKATGDGLQKLSNIGNDVYRQLRALKYPVNNIDFMFIFMIHQCLDEETCVKWNLERQTDHPVLSDFLAFLDRQAKALTTTQGDNKTNNASNEERKRISVADRAKFQAKRAKINYAPDAVTGQAKCIICKENHYIYVCGKFLKSSLGTRRQLVKSHNLCHNCLKVGHMAKDCKSKECQRCNVKHNRLLCNENPFNKQIVETKAQVLTRSVKKSQIAKQANNATCPTEKE